MPDHVTLRLPKPRITVYGVLVTAIVAWGGPGTGWSVRSTP